MVDGVTKLTKLEGRSDKFNQAENFRKLLLATSEDIRVLLVKLADRLHNMRTMRFLKNKEKRNRISLETLEIYAPIAERLGMHEVRSELEDLSFKIIEPEIRESIIERLKLLRNQDEDLLRQTIHKIEDYSLTKILHVKLMGEKKNHILFGKNED